jgi:hypothetical protein
MANVGLGIEEAQRLLGHESPTTTQVYYEVTDARLRAAAQRLRYDGRPPGSAHRQGIAGTRAGSAPRHDAGPRGVGDTFAQPASRERPTGHDGMGPRHVRRRAGG